MAFSKALYFTALLPSEEIKQQVLEMKMELKAKFGVKHALKLPAHITLQPPFWMPADKEEALCRSLDLKEEIKPFKVELNGFGRFGHGVIFIKVVDHTPIKHLHQKLLKATSGILKEHKEKDLHPHMTIATRDLTRENFQKIWPEFQEKQFSGSFTANSLVLFRHNSKTWDIINESFFVPGPTD